MYVLMLDLEGTLVFNKGSLSHLDYQIRPYAKRFVHECDKLFDEFWMNTSCPEEFINLIMQKELGFKGYSRWEWHRKKTTGYEKYSNDRVIHVEDGVPKKELDDFVKLGIYYIKLSTYQGNPKDTELLNALESINTILKESTS